MLAANIAGDLLLGVTSHLFSVSYFRKFLDREVGTMASSESDVDGADPTVTDNPANGSAGPEKISPKSNN